MKFLRKFREKLKLYLQNTSIHGFRYMVDPEAIFLEKLFWFLVSSMSIASLYFLFLATWRVYKSSPISFVTETSYLNWNTTFPAVAVCEAPTTDKIQAFAEYIKGPNRHFLLDNFLGGLLDYNECANCHRCSEKQGMCDVDISSLDQFYSLCEDIITDCRWGGQSFACCSLFKPLKTQSGYCFVINTMQTNGSRRRDLLSTSRRDQPGSLKFQLHERAYLTLMATEEVPFIKRSNWQHVLLEYGTQFHLKFQGTEIVNDILLKTIAVAQRMCRFPDETFSTVYPFYSFSACVVEHIIVEQIKRCGCQHHFMPASLGKVCDVEGLTCLAENWRFFKEIKLSIGDLSFPDALYCECLPSCTQAEFEKVFVKEEGGRGSPSAITIEMENHPTNRFIRNVVRTNLDLTVSLGGAAGLFMGASLLSLVEIVYFFCIRGRATKDELENASQLPEEDTHHASGYYSHNKYQEKPLSKFYGRYYPKDFSVHCKK